MSRLSRGLTEAALAVQDVQIASIPDPTLQLRVALLSLAIRVPYFILRELLPTESDDFVKEILESDKITNEVINSSEFQQALGATLESMIYAKDKDRRDLMKRAFTGAYISQDEYAKDHLERLSETAQALSLPALQHLQFIKREIISRRESELNRGNPKSSLVGFTDTEYIENLRRTTPISKFYDYWHSDQKRDAETEFNRNTNEVTRRAYDLSGATETKRRLQFSEYWSEYVSRGIFKQGNDPSIGTMGGGSGTVQYITVFGEKLLQYINSLTRTETE